MSGKMKSETKRSDTCCIIVTYNAMKWIDRCIGSILASDQKSDIILIDNCSSDDTLAHIEKKYPQVHVIVNQENEGFGGANNQGIAYAFSQGYSYFFLLNQDAWVDEYTLRRLRDQLIENPDYGIVSPIHLKGDRSGYDQLFYTFVSEDVSDDFLANTNQESNLAEVHFVNAAAWLISKSCIERVGLFHPLFFHYGEDFNYVQRLINGGLRIGIVNDAFVVHDREDRPPSKIKFDPIKRFERDLYIKLLDPSSRFGWIRYGLYVSNRVKYLSKNLASDERERLKKHALENFRSIYLKALNFDDSQLFLSKPNSTSK